MKKAPEAFRTISEVAELLETPAHVLRFWESKFYQLRPVKRAGRRRYYRPDDVSLIAGIRELLQVQGLTIRGVQRVLQEKGVRHVIAIGAAIPLPELSPERQKRIEFAEQNEDEDTVVIPSQIVIAGFGPPPAAGDGRDGADATAEPGAGDKVARTATVVAEPAELVADRGRTADVAAPAPAGVVPERKADASAPPLRLPGLLRQWPRERLAARDRERLAGLARRIDVLLDRMSEASGAGRW